METAMVLVKGIFWLGTIGYFIWVGQRWWIAFMLKEAQEIQARQNQKPPI